MNRRKQTKAEVETLKNAKQMHKKSQRLDPTWHEAKRIELGSEIVTMVTKRLPRWGAFRFNYTLKGV